MVKVISETKNGISKAGLGLWFVVDVGYCGWIMYKKDGVSLIKEADKNNPT